MMGNKDGAGKDGLWPDGDTSLTPREGQERRKKAEWKGPRVWHSLRKFQQNP